MDTNQPNRSPRELFETHDWIYKRQDDQYNMHWFQCHKCRLAGLCEIKSDNPYADLWANNCNDFVKSINNLSCVEIKDIINSHKWVDHVRQTKNKYVFWKICEICGAVGRSDLLSTNDAIIDMENFLSCNETIIKDIIE